MPATVRFSKEALLEAAFERVRREGFEALSARGLAQALGCSTQPIYDAFGGMEGLKQALVQAAQALFAREMTARTYPDAPPFLCMGLAYIETAREEPHLFRLLTLSGARKLSSLYEIGDVPAPVDRALLTKIWLFAHGIACVTAFNDARIPQAEIRDLLIQAAAAFRAQQPKESEDTLS